MRARNFLDDGNTVERRLLGRPTSFSLDGNQGFAPKQRKRQQPARMPSIGKMKDKSIWAFQVPAKMMYSTAGVFLVLPLFLFFWKETHVPGQHGALLEAQVNRSSFSRLKRTKNAAWMEDNLLDETSNTTSNALLPIPERKSVTNGTNVTDLQEPPLLAHLSRNETALLLSKVSTPKLGLELASDSTNITTDDVELGSRSLPHNNGLPTLRG